MEASLEARKKTAFKLLNDIFNEGVLFTIDEVCAKNIVVHVSGDGGDIKGTEAFKGYVKDFQAAFADIHLDVDDIHAEGDTVDAHTSLSATNIAAFRGKPRTGEEVFTEPVFFFKFGPDGKIVEHWQENLL